MQALQVVLFVVSAALALALLGYLLRSRPPRARGWQPGGGRPDLPPAGREPGAATVAGAPASPSSSFSPVAAAAGVAGAGAHAGAGGPGGGASAGTATVEPQAPARGAGPPPGLLVCPACRREYQLGLKYCPHDARALVPAGDPAARGMGPGLTCPACKRSFDANKKFCPYDAEELVPLALAGAASRAAAALPRVLGKICPHCAQRYESEATFCGRDGSELVSVN